MPETTIEVPSNLTDEGILNFFQGWHWLESPVGRITLDFRRTNFISPWAITLFGTYVLWLREVRHKNVCILLNESTVAGSYLCESGFLEILGDSTECPPLMSPERTATLTRISNSSDIPLFASRVLELLQIGDDEIEGAIKYSLVELLRNVVQHSKSPIGGIAMAQYYPSTGLVELVVADAGVGIKKTLDHKYPELDNDLKAIKFATQPHVSGTFEPGAYAAMKENAGLGLFFIKQIASLSGGGFFLGSQSVIADIWGDMSGTQKKLYKTARKGGWHGTFAVVQLRRETIADFDSVLKTCREMAEAARRDPVKLLLDFLEDIPELDGLEIIKVREFEENVDQAANIRDSLIEPSLSAGKMVVLDFSGIRFATQSFVHALLYKILRDNLYASSSLSIAHCSASTREAILAVAGYARIPEDKKPRNWQP